MNFTGYILAGGRSSRMGRDKAFLEIGKKTFLENSIEILAPVCGKIKIVLNKSQTHYSENLHGGVSYVFDIFENRGALGGIQAAFRDCRTELAVVLAVDLPLVTGEFINKLCEIISAGKDLSAVVPRQPDGRLQPLCAVYRVGKCLPKAEDILSRTASASMRDFLETLNVKTVAAEDLSENQDLFSNVNNPRDYESFITQKNPE